MNNIDLCNFIYILLKACVCVNLSTKLEAILLHISPFLGYQFQTKALLLLNHLSVSPFVTGL